MGLDYARDSEQFDKDETSVDSFTCTYQLTTSTSGITQHLSLRLP